MLLTKASSGGGGGGGGGGGPSDSYGAPPPSSYGPPSGGGGGYDYSGGGGGGGGWGRSFSDRIEMTSTNDHPQIIYPSMNSSKFYRSLDIAAPIQPFNNSLSGNERVNQKSGTFLNDWKSWNSTGSSAALSDSNTGMSSTFRERNDNEFVNVRGKTPELEKKIDKVSSTVAPSNYAKKWQNYEVADRILVPGTRIVALKRTSRTGRHSEPSPIAA